MNDITEGVLATFKAVAKNQGLGSAAVASLKANFSVDGTLVSSGTVAGPLVPGATTTIIASSAWTAAGIGPHTLRIDVDPDGAIPESNEVNNSLTLPFNVVLPPLTLRGGTASVSGGVVTISGILASSDLLNATIDSPLGTKVGPDAAPVNGVLTIFSNAFTQTTSAQNITISVRAHTVAAGQPGGLASNVLTFAVVIPAAPSSSSSFLMGISTGSPYGFVTQADVDSMVDLGVKIARFDFSQGVVQAGNFAAQDAIVNMFVNAGIQILGILIPSQTTPATSANWAAGIVPHYAALGVHIWAWRNEVNISGGTGIAVATYAAELIAAYSAIKAADPNAIVLESGSVPTPANTGGANSCETYLTGLYNNGAGNSFDGVEHHAYPFNGGTIVTTWPEIDNMTSVHNVLVAHSQGSKKIWQDECGFSNPFVGNDGWTEAQVPQMVANLVARLKQLVTDGVAQPMLGFYSEKDRPSDPSPRDQHFGLVHSDLTHKPSYAAFKAAALDLGSKIAVNCSNNSLDINLATKGMTRNKAMGFGLYRSAVAPSQIPGTGGASWAAHDAIVAEALSQNQRLIITVMPVAGVPILATDAAACFNAIWNRYMKPTLPGGAANPNFHAGLIRAASGPNEWDLAGNGAGFVGFWNPAQTPAGAAAWMHTFYANIKANDASVPIIAGSLSVSNWTTFYKGMLDNEHANHGTYNTMFDMWDAHIYPTRPAPSPANIAAPLANLDSVRNMMLGSPYFLDRQFFNTECGYPYNNVPAEWGENSPASAAVQNAGIQLYVDLMDPTKPSYRSWIAGLTFHETLLSTTFAWFPGDVANAVVPAVTSRILGV